MKISTLIHSKILETFSVQDFISYLDFRRDWVRVKSRRDWVVFEGVEHSTSGREIVLPEKEGIGASPTYKATALSMISDIQEVDPELMAKSIDRYESDLLYVKNTKVVNDDSVPLDVASQQIQNLKSLIQFAADMETRTTPYDVLTHTKLANKQASHYRLGHTFKGSFGFTIEAPLMTKEQREIQIPLASHLARDEVPTPRRVMERIARGLIFTSDSVKTGSADVIVNNYETGFNANMCKLLVSVSGLERNAIEYRVMWSPIWPIEPDILSVPPILVDDDELVYLEIAENRLKELREKTPVEVRGYVKAMSTTDNPLGNIAKRTIVLQWINNPFSKRRTTNLTIDVDLNAYNLVHPALRDWDFVLHVKGIAKYVKNTGWILEAPSEFRLEND